MVERAAFEMRCPPYRGPGVRIPPSPPLTIVFQGDRHRPTGLDRGLAGSLAYASTGFHHVANFRPSDAGSGDRQFTSTAGYLARGGVTGLFRN